MRNEFNHIHIMMGMMGPVADLRLKELGVFLGIDRSDRTRHFLAQARNYTCRLKESKY